MPSKAVQDGFLLLGIEGAFLPKSSMAIVFGCFEGSCCSDVGKGRCLPMLSARGIEGVGGSGWGLS